MSTGHSTGTLQYRAMYRTGRRVAGYLRGSHGVHSNIGLTWSSSRPCSDQPRRDPRRVARIATATSGVLLGAYWCFHNLPTSQAATLPEKEVAEKEYTLQEVKEHSTVESGVWVTYNGSVYDVTNFLKQHPGGRENLMLAAGGDLKAFWDFYVVHSSDHVLETLAEYKIGVLDAASREKNLNSGSTTVDDAYAGDPKRSPLLQGLTSTPYNGEPPATLLVNSYITPNELFYTRNHLPVPNVDADEYRLEVVVPGKRPLRLSLKDLKENFPRHTIIATLQCCGNRTPEMSAAKPSRGRVWGSTIISNAEWSGARLRDVLVSAGYDPEAHTDVEHVQFEGLDKTLDGTGYGMSIPIRKAVDPYGDTLLAYEMNGVELPRDHGYPVRALVPGVVGSRNVKWLSRVVASHEESQTVWQKNNYRSFSPGTDWENADHSKAPPIVAMPVQSAMAIPADGSTVDVDEETLAVKGYAWSGSGHGIVRVDVSIDGGKTWREADLLPPDDGMKLQKAGQRWDWTLWEADIEIPAEMRRKGQQLEVVCKAIDESHNSQPDTIAPIWNIKLYLNNAWDRRKVTIE